MTPSELTHEQVEQLVNTRDDATGLLYPPAGLQPYHDWLIQTLHRLAASSAADLRVSGSASAATDCCVSPGRASLDGTAVSYPGETLELGSYNNDTALVWLEEDAGEASVQVADAATGWPAGVHLKLAEVTLAGGAITEILDRRFETVFKV
ncbi:MAG: hypothetical protein ACIAXF_09860 [Phycisphaerales bacterium JB063]